MAGLCLPATVRAVTSCLVKAARLRPDLTGSQRTNVDYVLENLLDPSAIVGRAYRMSLVETADGRVITGIVKEETDSTLKMQTPTEALLLAKSDIEQRQESPLSMMPEGMLDKLHADEIRDLVAYLASEAQVSLPRQPALEPARRVRPISSIIFLLKAGRSSGLRLVTRPLSTTTS